MVEASEVIPASQNTHILVLHLPQAERMTLE